MCVEIPNIRVIKILTNDFAQDAKKRVTREVAWEGANIVELSELHPRSDVFGADSLGYAQIEDGWIRWSYSFERQSQDGTWTEINDPRVRVRNDEFEELEAEIDRENRRLYPGDYEDPYEEEDSYYDSDRDDPDDYEPHPSNVDWEDPDDDPTVEMERWEFGDIPCPSADDD